MFNKLIKPKNNIIANYLNKKAAILQSNCSILNQDVIETPFKNNQWFLDYLDKLNAISVEY